MTSNLCCLQSFQNAIISLFQLVQSCEVIFSSFNHLTNHILVLSPIIFLLKSQPHSYDGWILLLKHTRKASSRSIHRAKLVPTNGWQIHQHSQTNPPMRHLVGCSIKNASITGKSTHNTRDERLYLISQPQIPLHHTTNRIGVSCMRKKGGFRGLGGIKIAQIYLPLAQLPPSFSHSFCTFSTSWEYH